MGRHVLIDPSGGQLPLDGSAGVREMWGADGRYAPPIEHLADPAVGRDGAVLRDIRFGSRDVTLPLLIDGDKNEVVRSMMSQFSPRRGDSRLRYEADGGTRELVGRLAGVMAPDERGLSSPGHLSAILTFRAHDPFWRDPQNIQVGFSLDLPNFFPVPPLELTLDQLSTDAVIDNGGDVEAWPVWQIAGPTPGPVVLTHEEGAVLELERELVAGEVVTVDTRPGHKTVVSTVDGSVYGDLTSDSEMWPLQPGSQTVLVDIPSPGEDAQVILTFRRRWFTP